jgi:hypothetical protein
MSGKPPRAPKVQTKYSKPNSDASASEVKREIINRIKAMDFKAILEEPKSASPPKAKSPPKPRGATGAVGKKKITRKLDLDDD